jgi:putative membrane protein
MATTGSDTTLEVPAAAERRRRLVHQGYNWRLILVRVITSGLAVYLTVLVVPGLGFTGYRLGQFWVIAGTFAVLSAFVKPALQFFSLRFLVASYGLVVVLINAFLLWLLDSLLSGLLTYDFLWQLLLGGVVVGILGMFLDAVAGTSDPVFDPRAVDPRAGASA